MSSRRRFSAALTEDACHASLSDIPGFGIDVPRDREVRGGMTCYVHLLIFVGLHDSSVVIFLPGLTGPL